MGLFKNDAANMGVKNIRKTSYNINASFADKRSDVLWSAEMYLIRAVSYTYRQAISNPAVIERDRYKCQYPKAVNRTSNIASKQSKKSDLSNV